MSEEKGVVEGSVDSGAQVVIDTEAVLKEFKATYCVEGSVVLDAWIRQDFIEYCLSVDGLLKNPVPSEFKGMPTLITLFPRESDVGVSFTAAECDLVIAALNYASVNSVAFKAHLVEQGHPDTAKNAEGLESLRIKVTDRQHECQADDH